MQRVVYYARVSTEEEKQIKALNTQVQELESYIKTVEEWILIKGYVDEGRSGTTIKGRVEYQKLYNDILTDNFDIIVIKDIDRLSRNTLNWYLFIDRLVQTGKKLFFYNIKEFYKVDDKLITGIRALIAEQYSRDLSIKINNAHKTRAKKARAVTNGKMWGYYQKDGKLFINEEEAEIVKLIFSLYIQGFGFRSIQKKIDEIGYTSRNGTSFAMTTLKRIIKNMLL
jgi:DNA invertase Pin-like site-specific DNA recombinase